MYHIYDDGTKNYWSLENIGLAGEQTRERGKARPQLKS